MLHALLIVCAVAVVVVFGLVAFAMWAVMQPPVEGYQGEWVQIGTGRRYHATILPGGHAVELVNSYSAKTVTRDEFCRRYDKVRT